MTDNPDIFISYAHKNYDIVDEIDNDFSKIGISFKRDIRDLEYYGSISDFMKKVRDCDYVLMVISDAYLKSSNCMYEVLEIKKEKNYKDRILPILLDDATDIFKLDGRIKYIKYWQDEFERQKTEVEKVGLLNLKELIDELQIIERICREIGDFLKIIKDMKHQPYNSLKEANYKPISDFIGYKDNQSLSELIGIAEIKDIEDKMIKMDIFENRYGKTREYIFLKAYIAAENNYNKLAKYNYEEALKLNLNYVDAHNNLANLLQSAHYKDYEGARIHYEEALKLNPNDADVHNNLAVLLNSNYYKDYEGAMRHFNEALMLNPYYADAHKNLAILLQSDYYKDYEGAKIHYEEALKLK